MVLALTIVATWGIYALLGLGIVLIYRTSRVLNIAGGEIAVFVAYVAATVMAQGWGLAAAFAAAILVSMGLGMAIFWLVVRRIMGEPPHIGLMTTVGLGTVLNGMMIVLFGGGLTALPTGLPEAASIGNLRLPTAELVAAASAWLGVCLIAVLHWVTNLGLEMRAVAEKVTLSAQRGINVERILALSWVVGVIAAGLAGVLHGERGVISISASVIGISALIACLIGGMDSLKGVVIGAGLVAISENLTSLYLDPRYALVAPVAVLVLVLVVRPWGLFGTVEEFKRV